MSKLSVFIITKNEAKDLPRCLAALQGWVDEIVVVDDFSSDETPKIAESLGARVIQHRFEGFGAQKQFALEQTRNEWVLSLDADEVVSTSLSSEILKILQSPRADAYRLKRTTFFLGHPLRGTDRVVRLFRKEKARFTLVPIHEKVLVDGSAQDLIAPLEHYSYDSLDDYFQKLLHYSTVSAKERYARGVRFNVLHFFRPLWEMFDRIILRCAWRDGYPGVIYALLSSISPWLRAIKIWEIENREKRRSQTQ